jgi:hypothetical protein
MKWNTFLLLFPSHLICTTGTTSGWWPVGAGESERLLIRHIENVGVNSCYELKTARGKFRSFCYPNAMIIGVPKCGTSALFDLLATHPAFLMSGARGKETCRRFVSGGRHVSPYWFLKSFRKAGMMPQNKVQDIFLSTS